MKAKHSSINDVRGIGLLIAIEFKEDYRRGRDEGLLERRFYDPTSSSRHTLRVIPPLLSSGGG